MKKLNLPRQSINWVKEFMNSRSIELAFDEKRQKSRSIQIEISQESLISFILFLIYIRFLFFKLRLNANINSSSFIDDISISISSKSIEINCRILTETVKNAFKWADENAVKFDDFKSELIHFESKRKMSENFIILSNNIILQSQKSIKWLEIHIDRKLTFKTHVKNRIASATRVMHAINRLQNFQ